MVVSAESDTPLREYIKRRLQERGLSGRAAARAMGVSNSYFARVTSGRVTRPGVGFCVKLADLFGDSPVMVLRLAGWLPEDNEDVPVEEVRHLIAENPQLATLARIYQSLHPEARELFFALVRAAVNFVERRKEARR